MLYTWRVAIARTKEERSQPCALNLESKLQQHIDNDCKDDMFRESLLPEVKELSETAFGSMY